MPNPGKITSSLSQNSQKLNKHLSNSNDNLSCLQGLNTPYQEPLKSEISPSPLQLSPKRENFKNCISNNSLYHFSDDNEYNSIRVNPKVKTSESLVSKIKIEMDTKTTELTLGLRRDNLSNDYIVSETKGKDYKEKSIFNKGENDSEYNERDEFILDMEEEDDKTYGILGILEKNAKY